MCSLKSSFNRRFDCPMLTQLSSRTCFRRRSALFCVDTTYQTQTRRKQSQIFGTMVRRAISRISPDQTLREQNRPLACKDRNRSESSRLSEAGNGARCSAEHLRMRFSRIPSTSTMRISLLKQGSFPAPFLSMTTRLGASAQNSINKESRPCLWARNMCITFSRIYFPVSRSTGRGLAVECLMRLRPRRENGFSILDALGSTFC